MYQAVRKLLHVCDEAEIVAAAQRGCGDKAPALVRASIGLCNTEEDIDRMIAAVGEMTA